MNSIERVVFDCNTLLQALSSPHGPAGHCAQLAFAGKVQLFIAPAILDEVYEVATRPKVMRKLHLTADGLDRFLEAIQLASTTLADFPVRFTYKRDPDDALYVNLALAADANLIVSRDKDLLDLMNESLADGRDFLMRFPAIRILTPVGFLEQIGLSSGSGT